MLLHVVGLTDFYFTKNRIVVISKARIMYLYTHGFYSNIKLIGKIGISGREIDNTKENNSPTSPSENENLQEEEIFNPLHDNYQETPLVPTTVIANNKFIVLSETSTVEAMNYFSLYDIRKLRFYDRVKSESANNYLSQRNSIHRMEFFKTSKFMGVLAMNLFANVHLIALDPVKKRLHHIWSKQVVVSNLAR